MSTFGAIQRHKTAMVRYGFSQPVSLLVRHGLVEPGTALLDYGCGQGDDVRALSAQDVIATGWDPHFAPEGARASTTVVNLGFVLNVIEDPKERLEALERAWSLTEKVLAVAVMVQGQVPVAGLRPFSDGYLTTRHTFQKYYQHGEARAFIATATGTDPVSVAPGIFFVFKRPEDEQDFLFERRRGLRVTVLNHAAAGRPPQRRAKPPSPAAVQMSERIAAVITEITEFAGQRGRLPFQDELSAASMDQLARERVSLARACDACLAETLGNGLLERAAETRKEDLLVHQALGILNKTRSSQTMSPALVRDVRALFGSQRELAAGAMKFLFALSDAGRIAALCSESIANGIGANDDKGRLVVHGSSTASLAGALRCYIGCGVHLAGEPEAAYLVRLDPQRRRIKFFILADDKAAFPIVTSSIIINLRRQDVFIKQEAQRLIRKSRLFPSASKRQQALEKKHEREVGCSNDGLFEPYEQAGVRTSVARDRG